jgi:hypothetical protein
MTKNENIINWCDRINAGEDIGQIVSDIGQESDRLKNRRETIGPQTLHLIAKYSTLVGMVVMYEVAKMQNPKWDFKFLPKFFP